MPILQKLMRKGDPIQDEAEQSRGDLCKILKRTRKKLNLVVGNQLEVKQIVTTCLYFRS